MFAKSVFQTSVGCLSDDNRYMTPRKLYFVEFAKYQRCTITKETRHKVFISV